MPGVVNNPKNLSLRRAIMEYGTSRMCSEMLRRSLPLKMRDDDPTLGRFYVNRCFTQELANENLFVQFAGYGYVWTNLTKRMAFEAGGAVEYDYDFLMDGGTMYAYFRQKSTTAATFTTGLIEQPVTATLGGLSTGAAGPGGAQTYANTLGAQIMKNEVARGFTVIREELHLTGKPPVRRAAGPKLVGVGEHPDQIDLPLRAEACDPLITNGRLGQPAEKTLIEVVDGPPTRLGPRGDRPREQETTVGVRRKVPNETLSLVGRERPAQQSTGHVVDELAQLEDRALDGIPGRTTPVERPGRGQRARGK